MTEQEYDKFRRDMLVQLTAGALASLQGTVETDIGSGFYYSSGELASRAVDIAEYAAGKVCRSLFEEGFLNVGDEHGN